MVWARNLDPFYSGRAVNPMEIWRFSFEDCARSRLDEAIAEFEMVRTLIKEKVVSGHHLVMWNLANRLLKAVIREYRFFLGNKDLALEEGRRRGLDPVFQFHPRDAHVMAAIHSARDWRQWAATQFQWCKEDLVEMVTVGRAAIPRTERKEANKSSLYFANELARWGRLRREFDAMDYPLIMHWKYQLSEREIIQVEEEVDKEIAELDKALTEGLI